MTEYSKPEFVDLLICYLLSLIILVVDCSLPLGIAGGVPYVAMILLTVLIPRVRHTFYAGLWCSLLVLVGVFGSPSGGEISHVIANRVLALFAIWVTAGLGIRWKILSLRHQKALREREKALMEVRILKGLIPICSCCKKICNESGLWDDLEVYIRGHSEADFTHGFCPNCADELYATLAHSDV